MPVNSPRTETHRWVTVRIPLALVDRLDAESQKEDYAEWTQPSILRSEVVTKALIAYFKS